MPPRRKLIPGNTNSAQSFDFVRKLLKDCGTSHPLCVKPNPAFRPTRLIAVQPVNDAGDVQLRGPDVGLVDPRYIALSYCWGDVIPECRLTTSSLKVMKTRIAWGTIPQTMQDAILYTRRLGVSYLWIDAMCILQDNLDDWAQEAAMMAEVYQNSYLTLAALHGEDSNQGLFSTDVYEIHAFNTWDHPYLDYTLNRHGLWPLVRRGWCFQERILAPRVVFFGSNELLWECNTASACECQDIDHLEADRAPIKQKLFGQMQSAPNSKRWMNAWRYIVTAYTETKLSRPRDRLIAINGVAKLLSRTEKKGENYLAGIWSGSLLQDLAWMRSTDRRPTPTIAQSISNREEAFDGFVAPTWSWASVSHPVNWWHSHREAEEFI
ncbi:HET-domain-containing protein, partial [Thozetella sp. PMI_491]